MPRRNEEPEWDTDEDQDSNSGEESGFEDEGASEDMSYGDESGSAEEDEDVTGTEDDDASSGSEEESGSEGESGSEEDSESGSEEEDSDMSDSNSDDYSDDDDETTDADEDIDIDMEDVAFDDEDRQKGRGSTGSLLNDPSDKPAWARLIPAKIMALGLVAAGVCCFLMIALPLSLIIGLSVGLTRGSGPELADQTTSSEKSILTMSPTGSPSAKDLPSTSPVATAAPTLAPVIRATSLNAKATNTIYRDGFANEVSSGTEVTMLVQNGPAGNTELPSAYSLVQFDGIVGIDTNIMSVEAYLESIEVPQVLFCLNVASSENENKATYSTCLLPPQSVAIDDLTGTTAPQYTIPDDCLNDKLITFEVDSSDKEVCVDIAPLLVADAANAINATEPTGSDANSSLRGRRRLDEIDTGYLFMIDILEESDVAGTRFYSAKDSEGREPALYFNGENTCQTIAEFVCSNPRLTILCEAVVTAGLLDVLNSNVLLAQKTIFAPTDDAFGALSTETLDAITDPKVLKNILEYHVVADKIMSTDLNCNLSADSNIGPIEMANGGQSTTLCDDRGAIYQVGTGVSPGVNSLPEVLVADTETCYGVIHVIDQVLIPADDTDSNITCISDDETQFLADFCSQSNSPYSMFCAMADSISMNIFSSGMYTIFVPTNEALDLALAVLGDLEAGIATRLLLQHVISGSIIMSDGVSCDQEVEMANGDVNTITCKDDEIYIGGPGNDPNSLPKITEVNVLGCNVVIHSIDGVILPEISGPGPGSVSVSEDSEIEEENTGSDEEESEEEYTPCGICGEGLEITLTDAKIEIPDSVGLPAQNGDVTCQMADAFCRDGGCSPTTCTTFAEGIGASCGCEAPKTVADALVQSGDTFSTLVSLATRANLLQVLTTEQDFTLLAPTNDAFAKEQYNDLLQTLQSPEFGTHLIDVLLHHIILQQKLTLSDIGNQETVAANGETITFKKNKNDRRFVNGEKITDDVVVGSNGIIHPIKGVILPSWANQTVIDVIGKKNDLFVVSGLMEQANLVEILTGAGPFTIFAPINSAIEEELEALTALGLDPSSKQFAELLKYHVVPGIHPASSIADGLGLTTVQGGEILFNLVGETVTVNGKKITGTDILANNGIIHLIGGVLVPDGLIGVDSPATLPESSATQSCSICSGEPGDFILKNGDAVVSVPESVEIPNLGAVEPSCTVVEQICQSGYCNAEVCSALAESGAKETCGCE